MANALAFAPADTQAICAIDGDAQLNWDQLDDASNRLADTLISRGLQPGDVVALRMRGRLEWLVATVALGKAGASAVALNYSLAAPETLYILKDCGVRAVILDDADPRPLIESWADLGLGSIITVDTPCDGAMTYAEAVESGDPTPRPTAALAPMIVYSSGTTGKPKGAPTGGVAAHATPEELADYRASVSFDGKALGPRTLLSLPVHHGAGPSVATGSMLTGSCIIFQRKFDAEETLALMEKHRVTHWGSVPTMLQRILSLPVAVRDRYDLSSLRYVASGAAPFAPELKRRALDFFGDILHELYGATEVGMIAGITPEELRERPESSGRPFRQVSVKVCDALGHELPVGQTGEICVKTPMLIDGYIGRGPLSSDVLLPSGHYRTGDVGHLDAEGYLYVYDRATDMIISGGANVYPAEIEEVLNSHPDVALSAVLGESDEEYGERVVAVVQPREGAALSAEDLREYCTGRLASYKRPVRFDFIDQIPTSPIGKILKRKLRPPSGARQAEARPAADESKEGQK